MNATSRYCQGTTQRDTQCTHKPLKNEDYCSQHIRTHRQGHTNNGLPVPTDIRTAARQRYALALLMDGATFQRIADRLGYSDRSAARKAAMAALDQTVPIEQIQQYRQFQNARYEHLIRSWWAIALDVDHPRSHNAVQTVLRVMAQQTRLLGLNTPIRHEHADETAAPSEARLSMAERQEIVDIQLAKRGDKLNQIRYTPPSS